MSTTFSQSSPREPLCKLQMGESLVFLRCFNSHVSEFLIEEIMSLKFTHHLSLCFMQRQELPNAHMCCHLCKAFLKCDDKSVSSCVSAALSHGKKKPQLLFRYQVSLKVNSQVQKFHPEKRFLASLIYHLKYGPLILKGLQ